MLWKSPILPYVCSLAGAVAMAMVTYSVILKSGEDPNLAMGYGLLLAAPAGSALAVIVFRLFSGEFVLVDIAGAFFGMLLYATSAITVLSLENTIGRDIAIAASLVVSTFFTKIGFEIAAFLRGILSRRRGGSL